LSYRRVERFRWVHPYPWMIMVLISNVSKEEPRTAPCTFCPKLATNAYPASVSQLPGKPRPDGMSELVRTPPVWLCGDCTPRYQREEVRLGWCGECVSWGNAYSVSPCDELYMPVG
jgi:hypothetical protein